MVKTRTEITVPEGDICYTVVVHYGPGDRYDPTSWHMIYGYTQADFPPYATCLHYQNYLYQALLEALQWSLMPALVADMCGTCNPGRDTPHVPRWNIFRGPDTPPSPPCLFWSYWWGPPPWPPE